MLRSWSTYPRALAIAVAVLAFGPGAHASGANRVHTVDVQADGQQRVIRIQTASQPTFTVFRLSNPMRVVVDVSGGDVSSLESPLVFEDGVVSSIATRQFDANGFLIGRLTLGFETDVAYDVKAEGNAVVVRAAKSSSNLPKRAIVAPSAPITRGASDRVDELRREVAAAKRNAEKERGEAKEAKSRAAEQLAEAKRLASAAERSAKEAQDARKQATELRAEAKAAAARDRESLERRAAKAEARLRELRGQAQDLASQRAEAERAAAQAARSQQQAEAAAARAEALHKRQVAEQQSLIAEAQSAQAKAASEKKAAEAAQKRAIAAKREADAATARAEAQKQEAEASATEMRRKIAEIDRRESRAQAALAKLTEEKAAVQRERKQLERAKNELASAQASLEEERAAVNLRQKRLDAERKRLEKLRKGGGSKTLNAERKQIADLKAQVEKDKRALATERERLATQRKQLRTRQDELADKEAKLSTQKLVRQGGARPMLASTSVPSMRGSLEGVKGVSNGVLLEIDGSASYELLRVEDPPRLVVRLDNVSRSASRLNYGVNSRFVRRVRLGDHENATHAVLDLKDANVTHSVETTERGVLVSLRNGAPTPTTAVAVSDVRFDGSRERARVMIDVGDDVRTEVDDRSRRAWVLKLHGATVTNALEKSLDTSKFGSVVRVLSTYQASTEPPVVNVVATLRGAASQDLRREGNKLVWELTGVADAPKVASKTEKREQQTAAFRSAASAVSRSVMPTQRRRGQRVTLDFKDADIINVIRLIADTTGENIIVSDDVKGKVTVKLRNVPWERALDVILKSRGYDKVRGGGIIRISTAEAIARERELEVQKLRAQEQVEETVIKIVPINYANADDIVAQVKPSLSSRGSVQVDTRTNSLIIEDVRSKINRVVEISTVLDKQTPLVLIEARIVEAT
ncbi:MAG: AMIN domain-containing protein, partial [Myxococcota bacterium]